MKKPLLLSLLLTGFFFISFSATENTFTKKQKIIIYDKCFQQIVAYEELINKLGDEIDDIEKTNANIESVIGMFVNRNTLVYNDLDPDYLLSEFYEVETYVSNLSLWYPDGITINLQMENARSGEIINHNQGIYSMDILVNKKIDGNYINRKQNTNSEDLLFRVVFFLENGTIGETKIAGIRKAGEGATSFNQTNLTDVKSAELTDDQKIKIKQLAITVLGDYVNYMNLLVNPDELEDDKIFYTEALKNIVVQNDNNIFNDLEEEPGDEYLGLGSYIEELKNLYPSGINNFSLNIDSAEFRNVIREKGNSYYVYIVANKFFSGKLKGKKLFRFQDKLIFKVVFEGENGVFSNFNIDKIDHAGLNQAMMQGKEVEQDIASFTFLSEREREGLYFNLNVWAGNGGIIDQNLVDLTIENNFHEWNIEKDVTYGFVVGATYMLSNNVGIESGIGYCHLETKYSISSLDNTVTGTAYGDSSMNVFYDPTPYIVQGAPDAEYYKYIEADGFDSTLTLNYINIPFYGNIVLGKPGKLSLDIKAGFELSYMYNATYSARGNWEYYIFINDAERQVSQIPLEDFIKVNETAGIDQQIINQFNLYNRTVYKEEEPGLGNISKLDIRYVAHVGAEIPLGYFLFLTPGFTFKTTIGDLSVQNGDYLDVFGKTDTNSGLVKDFHRLTRKPIKTKQLLFEIGLKYKF